MPKTVTFADRLRSLREERGLSRKTLASKTGMHLNTIAQYERGARKPTWEAVQALARALDVPTDTFAESGRPD